MAQEDANHVATRIPAGSFEPADARLHLEVNVLGVLHGSQAFVRHLHQRGGEGVLVNVSSGAAQKPYAGWSLYCAAKAAVERMTECIALEEAAQGLRAHALAPGVIDTDMQRLIRATPAERFPEVDRFVERVDAIEVERLACAAWLFHAV